ncbi:MAG: inorganic diphosphatase [Candidatus Aenigmarchaeota archaeon]|nr:inorganic diphosphatase [Candidatus Aenigmarchaeota archaeon]MCK5289491.1 inorganic diphosphatase [Candidatus Aenigmarchaeota archaeon]
MKIIIETPKYSFFKYENIEGKYRKIMFSPIPTLFNYGYIDGTKGPDGMPVDVAVFGPRLAKGAVIERDDDQKFDGVIRFVDDSLRDDKNIIYVSGFRNTFFLSLYLRIYARYKFFRYLISKRKVTQCRFEGIEWY